MAEWDEQHYCPKCRDDLKGDDPCANSADCVICSTFSEDQKKKIRNRPRYKSKKDQNSSVSVDMAAKREILMILCWTRMKSYFHCLLKSLFLRKIGF